MIKKMLCALLVGLPLTVTPVLAQDSEIVLLEPAIWVDPNGCEHWVLDFGVEGMMSPHLDRNGHAVCNARPTSCASFSGDALFNTDEAILTADATALLRNYFTDEAADGSNEFLIVGHTDSHGSDAYNLNLGSARARAVAAIAQSSGATVRTGSQGEGSPIASNDTDDGRSQNRRVEIFCE